jgi:ankyrin repeat protein
MDEHARQLDFRILRSQRRDAASKLQSAQYAEAEALLKPVLDKSNESYGSDFYWRETTLQMLTTAYWEQKKWDEAERQLLQISADQARNERPRESAESKHRLALLALAKGDYVLAESYCQQALYAKSQYLGNLWDHSVYVSMQLLVEILQAKKDVVKATGYEETLKDERWTRECRAIDTLRGMTPLKASIEIGLNYLADLLPTAEESDARWKQIRKNIRRRSVGFCGSGHGYNLFHAAAQFGQEDTVRYLHDIEHESRLVDLDFLDAQDKDGNAALHFAANGRLEIARFLLKHGANVNIMSHSLRTPLMVAVKAGCIDIVRLLLDHDADIAAKDDIGWGAPHHAIFEGQGEILELLLENKADVGMLGASGRTPLHCAAVKGREDIVRLLLENGANATIKSSEEKTPLDLAEKHRRTDIVRTLTGVSQSRTSWRKI